MRDKILSIPSLGRTFLASIRVVVSILNIFLDNTILPVLLKNSNTLALTPLFKEVGINSILTHLTLKSSEYTDSLGET